MIHDINDVIHSIINAWIRLYMSAIHQIKGIIDAYTSLEKKLSIDKTVALILEVVNLFI